MSYAQSAWAAGDYALVGGSVLVAGELLCDSIPLHAGQSVLDVATGSGNTALAAARRGGKVIGIDWVPALLERARERAAVERLKIEFREGDAEAIPFGEETFDVVLSTFGAMFANPARAVPEMLRVCRSGGKIGMTNWTPDSLLGEMSRLAASFEPSPHAAESPYLWGVPEVARERFGSSVREIRFVRRQAVMRHYTPESWVKFMKKYFGPIIEAHQAAGDRAPEMTAAMEDLARRRNQSGDATLLALAEYIEVIATKA